MFNIKNKTQVTPAVLQRGLSEKHSSFFFTCANKHDVIFLSVQALHAVHYNPSQQSSLRDQQRASRQWPNCFIH